MKIIDNIILSAVGIAILFGFVSMSLDAQPQPDAPVVADVAAEDDTPKSSELGTVLPCKVLQAHDGDTVTVEIKYRVQVRLLSCWSPELTRPAFDKLGKPIINPKTGRQKVEPNPKGVRARDNLKKLAEGKPAVIHVPFNEEMDIGRMFTFGRVLGRLEVNGDDMSYAQRKGKFASATKPEEEALKPNDDPE